MRHNEVGGSNNIENGGDNSAFMEYMSAFFFLHDTKLCVLKKNVMLTLKVDMLQRNSISFSKP